MFGAWLSNGGIDGKVTEAALKKESEGGMERQWRVPEGRKACSFALSLFPVCRVQAGKDKKNAAG